MNVERPADLPDNVFTSKWMPQQSILAHPKCRGFISHGGLLGIHESICHGVPLVVFPIFAEQDSNADKIALRKLGIKLEITTVTEQKLLGAIQELLKENELGNNMKKISKLFKDRPISAVDTAVWWTEWVLRHGDTSALRPRSIHQSWWKKRNLDIWALVFTAITFLLLVAFEIIRFILTILFGSRKTNKVQMSQKDKIKSS